MKRAPRLAALSLLLASCGGVQRPSFSLSTPASGGDALAAVADRVRAAHAEDSAPLAVAVDEDPARGFAVLDVRTGAVLGRVSAVLAGRPYIAGGLVIGRVAGSVVAWTPEGAERWRFADHGLELLGASADGGLVAVVLGGGGVTRRRGELHVRNLDDGASVFVQTVSHALGAPVIAGGSVFLPWDGQNLSVLDARSGAETARLRSRDDVLGFARREGDAVYYGARSLSRLGAASAAGTLDGTPHYRPPAAELPGSPAFALDGYTALRAGLDARERVRLVWRPDPHAAGVAVLHGLVFAVFHRDVFALDAASGALRWAWVSAGDVAGLEVVSSGLLAVDDHGAATLLAPADGHAVWRTRMASQGGQVVLQVPSSFAPARNTDDGPRTALESLLEAAGGSDARLVPAQRFAVHELAAMPGAATTGALVSILTRHTLAPELRAAVGEALATRTEGTDAMLEALEHHADYVRGIEAPPSGYLARALAHAHERRAAAMLVSHLFDPATAVADLAPIVAALRELEDPTSLSALADFVRLYHADVGGVPPAEGGDAVIEREQTDQALLDTAVAQAVEVVARMGGAPEQALLDRVLRNPVVGPDVRAAANRAREGAPPDPQAAAADAGAAPTDMSFEATQHGLSGEQIETAMSARRAEVLECLRGAPSRPAQLRVVFRYDGEGAVTRVSVLPEVFEACVAPIVGAVQLPASDVSRALGTWICATAQ